MRKKLDAKELTKQFNELRVNNLSKSFTGKELTELFVRYNFNHALVDQLKKVGFACVRMGTTKLYSFKPEPFFHIKMEECLSNWRKKPAEVEISEEEKALQFLKKKGYQMRVCRGFDEARFAAENPELYQKYLIYEEV